MAETQERDNQKARSLFQRLIERTQQKAPEEQILDDILQLFIYQIPIGSVLPPSLHMARDNSRDATHNASPHGHHSIFCLVQGIPITTYVEKFLLKHRPFPLSVTHAPNWKIKNGSSDALKHIWEGMSKTQPSQDGQS